MASLDILHPLANDQVDTTVEVLVAYDFRAFKAPWRIWCSITGPTSDKQYKDVSDPYGQVYYTFSWIVGDYTIDAWCDDPKVSDQESPVTVAKDPPIVIKDSTGPPFGSSGYPADTFTVTGTNVASVDLTKTDLTIQGYGLMPKSTFSIQGCVAGLVLGVARLFGAARGSRPNKWKKVSDKVKAEPVDKTHWRAKVMTEAHKHDIMFEAILHGPSMTIKQKQSRGHKR